METTSMILATLLASTILLQGSIISAATTAHVVGGSTGWTIPPNATFFSEWASSRPIASGDILVFQYRTGLHTVVEVPKSSYDACSTAKKIGSTIMNGPATITVTSGTHYYICGVLGHCSAGMKLAVTVPTTAIATAPSMPPTTSKPAPAAAPISMKPAPAVAPAAPKMSGPTASSPVATPKPAAAAPAPAPKMSSPMAAPEPAVAAPAPAPVMFGPTTNSPMATPAMAPAAGPTTASSPSPAAGMEPSASSPAGSIPTVPGSPAMPSNAPGPMVSGSENGASSSPALRSATGTMVALLAVATAYLLV